MAQVSFMRDRVIQDPEHARTLADLSARADVAEAQRDHVTAVLRRLLPLLDSIGMTTHDQQAAIREARAVVAEGKQ